MDFAVALGFFIGLITFVVFLLACSAITKIEKHIKRIADCLEAKAQNNGTLQ